MTKLPQTIRLPAVKWGPSLMSRCGGSVEFGAEQIRAAEDAAWLASVRADLAHLQGKSLMVHCDGPIPTNPEDEGSA